MVEAPALPDPAGPRDPVAPGVPVGRREQKKAATRARLLAAARTLFVERGYDATRPQDVARTADVAVGTFYVHFADKRAAFQAFTEEAAGELMARIQARGGRARGFERRLEAILLEICAYQDEHPGVLRAAFADGAVIARAAGSDGDGPPGGGSLRERLAERLCNGLRAGMASGELRADYDPRTTAHAVVGLVESGLVHGAREGRGREELVAELSRFCTRALVAPRARPSPESEDSP